MIDQHTALLRVRPQDLDQLLHPGFDAATRRAPSPTGGCSPAGCRRRRGRPSARWSSTPTARWSGRKAGREGDPGARARPRPRTSPACTPRRASSPPAAAGPPTRRWWPSAWASLRGRGRRRGRRRGAPRLRGGRAHRCAEGDIDLRRRRHRRGDPRQRGHRRAASCGDEFKELLAWADRYRDALGVRANADTPEDARKAREFGAEGIGLVRTEHMFFAPDRIPIVREMIMAADRASPPRPRVESSCPSSGTTSSASSGPWTGCRSRSGCSIRPCTSSCPRSTRSCWRSTAAGRARHQSRPAAGLREISREDELAAGGQPDAGAPRLPARHHLSRDLRHAGAGHHGGGLHGRPSRA